MTKRRKLVAMSGDKQQIAHTEIRMIIKNNAKEDIRKKHPRDHTRNGQGIKEPEERQ